MDKPEQVPQDHRKLIAYVQDTFQLSLTDFSNWLGVSRAELFTWRQGDIPPDEAMRKIEKYVDCAKQFENVHLATSSTIMFARFFNGESAKRLMLKEKALHRTNNLSKDVRRC